MEAFEFCRDHASHDYTMSQNAQYYLLWIIHAECYVKLEQNKPEEARAAVKAFTELLRAKLESGDRSHFMLFAAIRLTEVSSAGKYQSKLPSKLAASDLQPVWNLIKSVKPEEWDNNAGGNNSTCLQMIERATG
jgi:hypothetical protein